MSGTEKYTFIQLKMLTIEAEFIAAIETDVGLDFIENGVVEDRIEFAELNDFVWREKAHSLDFCASEKHFHAKKNCRSFMQWLKNIRSFSTMD